jgi:hypothetical protein
MKLAGGIVISGERIRSISDQVLPIIAAAAAWSSSPNGKYQKSRVRAPLAARGEPNARQTGKTTRKPERPFLAHLRGFCGESFSRPRPERAGGVGARKP